MRSYFFLLQLKKSNNSRALCAFFEEVKGKKTKQNVLHYFGLTT